MRTGIRPMKAGESQSFHAVCSALHSMWHNIKIVHISPESTVRKTPVLSELANDAQPKAGGGSFL